MNLTDWRAKTDVNGIPYVDPNGRWVILFDATDSFYVGQISELEIAGIPMIRLSVPETSECPAYEQYYTVAGIHSLFPIDEAAARRVMIAYKGAPFSKKLLDAIYGNEK